MRIVIDLQAAQGLSRFRGIGRYSMALAQAMVRSRGEHEIFIALNGMLPDSVETIRAAFDGILPQENIVLWGAAGPVNPLATSNKWRQKTAELIRENFLASLKPDIVHVTSLFEGWADDAVHSIGLSGHDLPTAVTFYDLIPLIERAKYLTPNPAHEAFYVEKLSHLRKADLYLAISGSSRLELIDTLAVDDSKVVNISAAADDHFRPLNLTPAAASAVRDHFGLNKPFIMYSGATDERKNHLRLIKAFSLLPRKLKEEYQLAIVGKISEDDRDKFCSYARDSGLKQEQVIITGQVSDEQLTQLYNLCVLFAFPSWHEGFGLPVLEAMSCGTPVIAANTTSLPEVVGRADALFDPFDADSIANKIQMALSNAVWRAEMSAHGLTQASKFSWEESARRALCAFEDFHARHRQTLLSPVKREKLAFVSPLPPERTGIADYSAELLPELSLYYDIHIITPQDFVSDDWISKNCKMHDVEWFVQNCEHFDRVLYHFGNSPFHQHMFGLLEHKPGVIILHDFYLGGVMAYMDATNPGMWSAELYRSHGYKAVAELAHSSDWSVQSLEYPSNSTVTKRALGVIVHSEASRRMAEKWLGEGESKEWKVVPLGRDGTLHTTKEVARKALGINSDAFVVCSFGLLDPTKQNHRLLKAWLNSPLSQDKKCQLIFVGENHGGDYGNDLKQVIAKSGLGKRIHITGWTDGEAFQKYLAAADIGVQLRTSSRGEASASVLDCMKYSLATVVNAHGSMAELPDDSVCLLPDEFDDGELQEALTMLWQNEAMRTALGARAREGVLTGHAPRVSARSYAYAIEAFYSGAKASDSDLISKIGALEGPVPSDADLMRIAKAMSQNAIPSSKQLLVDVSALVNTELKTGVERVVGSILMQLLNCPPAGYRVEPVYADANELGYRYARQFTLKFLKCPQGLLEDEPIETGSGDIFLGLDLQQIIVAHQSDYYQYMRRRGVGVYFVVYDLLPVLLPDVFPNWAAGMHDAWLTTVQMSDGVMCISRAVADEMMEWLSIYGSARLRPFHVGWFHLGADLKKSAIPSKAGSLEVIARFKRRPTFLMVGTIEPRKGHMQVLAAFEKLWKRGVDINLVIVGSEGWKGLPDEERRNIPQTIKKLSGHPETGHRLFWLNGICDSELEDIYAHSNCLIAASQGEGFGLPLVEAMRHGLPIIARDIAVFREVAGGNATYFSGGDATELSEVIDTWLRREPETDQTTSPAWLSWSQSTQDLLAPLFNGVWYSQWLPDDTMRYWPGEGRFGSEAGVRQGRSMRSDARDGYILFGPYLTLPAGQYKVILHGKLIAAGTGGIKVDVAADNADVILAKTDLHLAETETRLVSLIVSLERSYSGIEFRVWAGADANVTLSMIEVLPQM